MNNLFSIITILLLTRSSNEHYCSKTINQGPFKLRHTSHSTMKIQKNTVSMLRLTTNKEEVTAVNGYRSYWKSYCYNGGNIDPNTGCYNSLNHLPPNEQEILEWLEKGMCQIGEDCINCWGSDSEACLDIKLGKWTRSKELTKLNNNNNFAYHTCNLSWRCGISNSNALIYCNDEMQLMTVLPNGKSQPAKRGIIWKDKDFVTYLTETPSIIREQVVLPCIYDSEKDILVCQDKDYTNVMIVGEHGKFVNTGNIYYLLNKTEKHHEERSTIKDWKSASIHDLKALMRQEQALSQEFKYDLTVIAHRLELIEDLLVNLVNSLGKVDDHLIGNLFRESFQTTFITPESFIISPCTKPKTLTSNCIDDHIYTDGRWTLNNDPTKCLNLTHSKNLDLFDDRNLWIPEIANLKFDGTAREQSGWSFYAEERENLKSTMTYTKNGGRGTSIEDISEWGKGTLNGFVTKTVFGLFGNLTFTILVIVAICLFMKKF